MNDADSLYAADPNGFSLAEVEGEPTGCIWVFETARIYRGKAPALPLDQIYGITSFELG